MNPSSAACCIKRLGRKASTIGRRPFDRESITKLTDAVAFEHPVKLVAGRHRFRAEAFYFWYVIRLSPLDKRA